MPNYNDLAAARIAQNVADLEANLADPRRVRIHEDSKRGLARYQEEAARIASIDLNALVALDKVAVRSISDADLKAALSGVWYAGAFKVAKVLQGEETRRRRAATVARRQEKAAASTVSFVEGEQVEVLTRGVWYPGKVIKVLRSGAIKVLYTTGTGNTWNKTSEVANIRKVA